MARRRFYSGHQLSGWRGYGNTSFALSVAVLLLGLVVLSVFQPDLRKFALPFIEQFVK